MTSVWVKNTCLLCLCPPGKTKAVIAISKELLIMCNIVADRRHKDIFTFSLYLHEYNEFKIWKNKTKHKTPMTDLTNRQKLSHLLCNGPSDITPGILHDFVGFRSVIKQTHKQNNLSVRCNYVSLCHFSWKLIHQVWSLPALLWCPTHESALSSVSPASSVSHLSVPEKQNYHLEEAQLPASDHSGSPEDDSWFGPVICGLFEVYWVNHCEVCWSQSGNLGHLHLEEIDDLK